MPDWWEKLRLWTKEKKGRRGIENLVIILILGVIIIIVASSFFTEDEKEDKPQETIAITSKLPVDELLEFERRLEQILSEIEGAGQVKVMITRVSDGEVVHAYNQIEESSLQEEQNETGVLKKTDEIRKERELVFMDAESGKRIPVVTKTYHPEIMGVVVVADGAGSNLIRQNITDAVEALLGIPVHRIRVLKRK
ncbi:MAG: stage III sporulation protein AG [Clostridiaceae bacterium]|jgi:stage III sporulation protein AG|nr:stage III sporulation protein AG [Clostridiaceae bacterium]